MHDLLRLSPEVADALRENLPIVALESTLITFGLPWPANAETALAMERAVRECGAVPATIAVLGGQITDTRVETPREAAAIIAASRRLGLERAVIIAVPVPEDHEFAGAEAAIAEATAEAEHLGIRGKHVTPFLLKRVTELTGGASQAANGALLVNSARAAALIVRELCTMNDGAT